MTPLWSHILTFVAGLVGGYAIRLVMGNINIGSGTQTTQKAKNVDGDMVGGNKSGN